MLEQLVGIAKDCLRSLLAERRRTARARLRWHVDRHRPSLRGEWEARGVLLLRQWLSPEQLAQYDARSYFEVTGCDSGKRYRISHGTAMNIREARRRRPCAGWLVLCTQRLSRCRRCHAGAKNCARDRRAWSAGGGEQILCAVKFRRNVTTKLNVFDVGKFARPRNPHQSETTSRLA